MLNVNEQNLFNFLILVTLCQRIRGEFGGIKEQREIAPGPQLKNNFGETLRATVITTAITEGDEKFDDNELRKLFMKTFKMYENLEGERNKHWPDGKLMPRKTRDVPKGTYFDVRNLKCHSCYSTSDNPGSCYKDLSSATESCLTQCYTELHPNYIRRGCLPAAGLNRTFVCKCPLCNDKTASDLSFFEYKKLSEWQFDNERLMTPVDEIDLLCKICKTNGLNKVADKTCRLGKDADYLVCGHNQFCYTNIDITGYVSRGCVKLPAFNSIYFYCNNSFCNNEQYLHKYLITKLRTAQKTKIKAFMSCCDWIHCKNLFLSIVTLSILSITGI